MKSLLSTLVLICSFSVFAQNDRQYAPVNPLAGTFAMQWMTYAGASDTDELLCVKDMPDGGVVVCGRTMSNNFPGTDSSDALMGGYDMVIFRMDSAGQILWTTIYGGLYYESANALVVYDTSIYVVGATNGNDCPMINAFQSTPAGSYDAVILRLGFDGTVQQSSYFGGTGGEFGYGIDVDSTGLIVIGGSSTSSSLPQSTLGFQQAGAGANDCFITVLNSAFAPQWTTFYGGSGTEDVHTLAVTPRNEIVLCGGSFSTNFPCTPGAFQSGRLGICDAYYVVFTMSGARQYATYYGGSGNEDCFGIAGDADGNIYLAGHTSSIDFPTNGTTFQSNYQGVNDAWIARFDAVGTPYFSTFFGGSVDDKTWGMIRRDGYLYLCGVTSSLNLPMNVTAPQDSMWGSTDGFIMKMDTAGNYVSSTYFGGSGADDIMSITVNADTIATCVGVSYSNNLPVLNSYQSNYVGNGDGFAVRYKLSETWMSNSIPDGSEFEDLRIYPNPGSTKATVQSIFPINSCRIYTIDGQIANATVDVSGSETSIGLDGLAAGIYMVIISTNNGDSILRLIVE
jgi:hypothetical protein